MRSTKSRVLAAGVLVLFGFIQLFGSGVSPSAYQVIMQAGSALTRRNTVNFTGDVTCVDNAGLLRTDCAFSGVVAPGSGAGAFLYSATGSATNAAAAEATVIGAGTGSLTLGANFFDPAGVTIKIQATGYYSTQAAPGTLRIRLKLGTTTILDTGAVAPTPLLTNQVWTYDAFITSRTLGAKGTVMAQSEFRPIVTATTSQDWPMVNTAAVGLDTTVTQAVDLTAEWSVAGGNTITGTNFLLYALTTTPGYATIQNAGTAITRRGIVNMGAGVYCVDNAGSTRSDCYTGVAVANEGVTGTTVNKLAKLTGAPSTAIVSTAGDTGGAVGIVVAGAGAAGTAVVATGGTVSCVFDGATTAGHYVGISAGTAGDCTDAGATYPTSGQVVGRVLSTNVGAGTYSIVLFPPELKAAAGGGGGATVTTIGALPGACTNGTTYNFSDSLYTVVCNPANTFNYFYGSYPVTRPPSAGWSWDNQTTSTIDSTNGYEFLVAVKLAAVQQTWRYRTAPATPYTVTATFLFDITGVWDLGGTGALINGVNILFRESGTGKGISFNYFNGSSSTGQFAVMKWTTSTTFSAAYNSYGPVGLFVPGPAPRLIHMRMSNDGVNLKWYLSTDGAHWSQFDSRSKTDFMAGGPDQIGFGAYSREATATVALINWTVT